MKGFGNYRENPYGYREGRIFKQGVEQLASIPLSSHDKICILSVALGLKKAGNLITSLNVAPGTIESVLSKLGLIFGEDKNHIHRYREATGDFDAEFVTYIYADSTDSYEEVYNAFENHDARAIGRAFDYPSTAVEAYTESLIDDSEESLMSQRPNNQELTDEERRFVFFRFSKEHFEEEIAWLEQLIAGVKTYAPQIYDQIMAER